LAGLLVACEELDPQRLRVEAVHDVSDSGWRSLALLPLALRCGCDSESSLSWFRFGLRLRRPAHRLAQRFPLPPGVVGDATAREWVGTQLAQWLAQDDLDPQEDDYEVLAAIRILLATD
jgi:hypothetical protein